MGFFAKIVGEFIDIIEWIDDSSDTLVYRFERYDNEIKYGAKLTVREGQYALFVNEGKLADGFGPGMYTLETQNIPVLTTLNGWKYGFSSPFKAEVYFVSLRTFTNIKWGTRNPIMLRDPEFGPVRLRGFGSFSLRVTDPRALIAAVVGTDGRFTLEEITEQLRSLFVSRFADALAESRVPLLDLSTQYDELGLMLQKRIGPEFQEYGLELGKPLVENISLPEEVEKILDKRTSMGMIGDLGAFNRFQASVAMEKAAENPGQAGGMMGMGVGVALGQQTIAPWGAPPSASAAPPPPPTSAAPPPPPVPGQYHLVIQGRQQGPYDLAGVRQWIASGQVTGQTLAWKPGMAQWVALQQFPEWATMAPGGPPPLPNA
ncbi:MAG: SPFH domain-containing protein [Magnetococcales bacterium]|nr:SPFH domain-containing protein [Magnetococcales bacterium]MBF0149422.1 SPFH domain-containing protein [Magnetococcales bacterium]